MEWQDSGPGNKGTCQAIRWEDQWGLWGPWSQCVNNIRYQCRMRSCRCKPGDHCRYRNPCYDYFKQETNQYGVPTKWAGRSNDFVSTIADEDSYCGLTTNCGGCNGGSTFCHMRRNGVPDFNTQYECKCERIPQCRCPADGEWESVLAGQTVYKDCTGADPSCVFGRRSRTCNLLRDCDPSGCAWGEPTGSCKVVAWSTNAPCCPAPKCNPDPSTGRDWEDIEVAGPMECKVVGSGEACTQAERQQCTRPSPQMGICKVGKDCECIEEFQGCEGDVTGDARCNVEGGSTIPNQPPPAPAVIQEIAPPSASGCGNCNNCNGGSCNCCNGGGASAGEDSESRRRSMENKKRIDALERDSKRGKSGGKTAKRDGGCKGIYDCMRRGLDGIFAKNKKGRRRGRKRRKNRRDADDGKN